MYVPVEVGYIFAFGHFGRTAVDDLAITRGKHNLHMNERYGQFLRLEYSCGKKFVKVRSGYYFRAVRSERK